MNYLVSFLLFLLVMFLLVRLVNHYRACFYLLVKKSNWIKLFLVPLLLLLKLDR